MADLEALIFGFYEGHSSERLLPMISYCDCMLIIIQNVNKSQRIMKTNLIGYQFAVVGAYINFITFTNNLKITQTKPLPTFSSSLPPSLYFSSISTSPFTNGLSSLSPKYLPYSLSTSKHLNFRIRL